jgi:hypothetical protein
MPVHIKPEVRTEYDFEVAFTREMDPRWNDIVNAESPIRDSRGQIVHFTGTLAVAMVEKDQYWATYYLRHFERIVA